jgi:hypothetical protein
MKIGQRLYKKMTLVLKNWNFLLKLSTNLSNVNVFRPEFISRIEEDNLAMGDPAQEHGSQG